MTKEELKTEAMLFAKKECPSDEFCSMGEIIGNARNLTDY